MAQNALNVMVRIRPGETDSLRTFLLEIGDDIRHNPHLRFAESPTTHFARFVIVDDGEKLMFTSDFDGPWDVYVEHLVDLAPSAIDTIFGKCEGYPGGIAGDRTQFKRTFCRYLKQHTLPITALFSAYRGETVQNIKTYGGIREQIERWLNRPDVEPLLVLLAQLPPRQASTEDRVEAAIGAILSFPLQVLVNGLLPLVQRILVPTHADLSQSDPTKPLSTPYHLTERESIAQNELTIISTIKKGHVWRLKLILSILNFAAKYLVRGSLSGITTIHFARWFMYDRDTRLMFESNYDGTWENYIGDFSDKAYGGIDAVWGNCKDYPPGGARDLQAFKNVIIKDQIRAEVFYSAYPSESVSNILNDIEIARKVKDAVQRKDVEAWLQRL